MNCLERNKKISYEILEDLKKNPLVEGVMFLGGVARGFADEDSDIDIAVFSDEKICDLSVGENFDDRNIDVEFWNIKLSESSENWSQIQREAYDEGIIVFDRNGKVKKYIDNALYYSEDKFLMEFGERFFHLAWHGIVYSKYRNKKTRGYNWILPNDMWYKRKNKENGFLILQQCALIYIELLFVVNKKWIPDFKWIWIKSNRLAYLPKKYKESMEYILFERFDDGTWKEKMNKFQELLDELYEHIEPELPENLYDLVRHEYE